VSLLGLFLWAYVAADYVGDYEARENNLRLVRWEKGQGKNPSRSLLINQIADRYRKSDRLYRYQ